MRREHFVTAEDGTTLYVDDRGPVDGAGTPVICIPGLTRNGRDFEPVFALLAGHRRVIALDLRGRGRSSHAKAPESYTPVQEHQDVLRVLDHLDVRRAALIGTSRGGIIGMVMANLAPQRLAGLLLNDIGPALAPKGLQRIAQYVGTPVSYANWADAAKNYAESAVGFRNVSEAQWLAIVQRLYRESGGRIVHTHDLALVRSLPSPMAIAEGKIPELWAMVPALRDLPVALLRGEGSDLLTEETALSFVDRARIQHFVTVPDRGHAPFLDEAQSIETLKAWLNAVDKHEKGR